MALLLGLAAGVARATRLTGAGVALGFVGVLGVVHGNAGGTVGTGVGGYLLGIILIASASLSYGAGAVLAKRWLQGVEPVVIATFQLTLTGLLLLPLTFFGPHPAALHWKSAAAVTALGVLGSGLAYLLFFRLLATISPTRAVAVTYLLPIWGLLWGSLAGEEICRTALAGVVVVLAGLVLMNVKTEPKADQNRSADWQMKIRIHQDRVFHWLPRWRHRQARIQQLIPKLVRREYQ